MDKVEEILTRGVDEVIIEDSLRKRLKSKKRLVVKLGIDPTGDELHLGHAVVLKKLREFQDLGHQAVMVIGDFTAKIGDPSGRTQERKRLTEKQIRENMKSYKRQAGKILDLDSVRFTYNSKWFNKIGLEGVLGLASKATVAQIFERKEFRERYKHDIDIPYLEMLYPLMQGYDSVELRADVELGGTDQKFNLLMGRQIQKKYSQKEQDIVIMKLLLGTDGAKMSKSAGNYIALAANPFDMYGKIMSIPDELLPQYYELCTGVSLEELEKIRITARSGGVEVFNLKKQLAKTIVTLYHGIQLATKAEQNFETVHEKGKYEESKLVYNAIEPGIYESLKIPIASGATTGTAQAKELIQRGSVEINSMPIMNPHQKVQLKPGDTVKIGKWRIIKVENEK